MTEGNRTAVGTSHLLHIGDEKPEGSLEIARLVLSGSTVALAATLLVVRGVGGVVGRRGEAGSRPPNLPREHP